MMYKDMTTQQKLGLTDEGVAELKKETHDELVKLGFSDFLKADVTDTYEAIAEQIDNDPRIADRVFDVVFDEYASDGIHKDNYDKFLETWIDEKADYLHT